LGFKPLLFVAMPFGQKLDVATGSLIDFDDLYQGVIVPAGRLADVDMLRADEERMGGFIHLPMYERLLLAELAIVDLTLANPNVLYELGVRHAARPRATILIYHQSSVLPFDVGPLRAIPYRLEQGLVSNDDVSPLIETLAKKIQLAKEDHDSVDSPLFQLIPRLAPVQLPHEATESFRDRVQYIDQNRAKIMGAVGAADRVQALKDLCEIEREMGELVDGPADIIIDLLLAYRDVQAWEKMVMLINRMPQPLQDNRIVREQLAFALNRRNQAGDWDFATKILLEVIRQFGPNPETCGILGRVYKDRFYEARAEGKNFVAEGFLDEAIRSYRMGFEADPRDYYPGINAATLLAERGRESDMDERDELLSVIQFAVARRGGLNSENYWDLATILEVAVHRADDLLVDRSLKRIVAVPHFSWMVETTVKNLKIVKLALTNVGQFASVSLADKAISILEEISGGRA
jgi:hypothetical protein